MYSSIYDSPFPKINPKVRYKTALERAGFDTRPRNLLGNQRSASSTGSLQATLKSPPIVRQRNVSAAPSVPVITKSEFFVSPNSSHPSAKGESSTYAWHALADRGRPSVDNSNIPSSSTPTNAPHPSFRTSECSSQDDPFRFERVSAHHHQEQYAAPRQTNGSSANVQSQVAEHSLFNFEQTVVGDARREEDLSPIEKSFMMLTQNDTASLINSSSPTNNESVHAREIYSEHEKEEEEEEEEVISVKYQEMNPEEEEEDDVDSLNFQPHPELDVSLGRIEPPQEEMSQQEQQQEEEQEKILVPLIPEINVTRKSVTPLLFIDTSYNSESIDSKLLPHDAIAGLDVSKEVKSPAVSSSSTNVEDLSLDGSNEKRFSAASSENVETPYTATNLQVEQLIAQLDDVSLSRNAQLDLNGDSLNLVDRKASRFKKSSAYLSGFPSVNMPPTQQTSIMQNSDGSVSKQSLSIDDDDFFDGVPSAPTTNGDTPIFYKFKQSDVQYSSDEGNSSQEDFKAKVPTIEALQLQHKDSITNSSKETDNFKLNDSQASSDAGTIGHSPCASHLESEPTEIKYPPGEGPCRACGLEVTGKRMFSKKENELSGQWHRECFKCVECGIKFNKHVPCYILCDTPYCQKHYHQENHSICKVCSNFIEGECLENDKVERFHVDCLSCFLCKAAITNDYFIFNGEIPLCGNHDLDALLKEGIDNTAPGNDKNNTVSKRRTRLVNFN
ncbi:pxl1p [Saccharomyces arboricola H-6]|uniref:Pxl1p n=1 Tax=Saccharomyces arboricola (strain H-6 / AS 2.3317 / CBS 10644) TaxID=1160507 RepID=J8LLA5_SACAR|nr:pxl1p [Saccharomyces arboricola H-6]